MLARVSSWLRAWLMATIRPLALGLWKLLVLVGLSRKIYGPPRRRPQRLIETTTAPGAKQPSKQPDLFPQHFVVDKLLVHRSGLPIACGTDASFGLVQVTNPQDGSLLGWDTIEPYQHQHQHQHHQLHQHQHHQHQQFQPQQGPQYHYQHISYGRPIANQNQANSNVQYMNHGYAPSIPQSVSHSSLNYDSFAVFDSDPLDVQKLMAGAMEQPPVSMSFMDDSRGDAVFDIYDQKLDPQPGPVPANRGGLYPLVHSRANSESGQIPPQATDFFDADKDFFHSLLADPSDSVAAALPTSVSMPAIPTVPVPHSDQFKENPQMPSPLSSSTSSFQANYVQFDSISPQPVKFEELGNPNHISTLSPPMSSSSTSSPPSPSKVVVRQPSGTVGQYTCPQCGASFRIKGYLTRHLKKHATKKAYNCPFYDEDSKNPCHPTGGFSRRDTYKTHLKARHFLYPSGTRSEHRAHTPGVCGGCSKEFGSNEEWIETHIQTRLCKGFPHHS